MEFNDSSVAREHGRIIESLDEDPYCSPKTICLEDVINCHFLISDHFLANSMGDGISQVGPRSWDLLHSCLYRQFAGYGGKTKWSNDLQVVATLFYGIIKDHPFHDANKRTAFIVSLYHLYRLKRFPEIGEKEYEKLTVAAAEGQLHKYKEYKKVRKEKSDNEVYALALFLKKNTREIDKNMYLITYRELKKILEGFGYYLENPHNNSIDVVNYKNKRRFFKSDEKEKQKVYTLKFPGWSKQVGKPILKDLRESLNLTERNGVDSQVFFKDYDPLSFFLSKYQGPLERLAHK